MVSIDFHLEFTFQFIEKLLMITSGTSVAEWSKALGQSSDAWNVMGSNPSSSHSLQRMMAVFLAVTHCVRWFPPGTPVSSTI